MRDEAVEREMYRRAVQLIETRYPTGWGGAGVVHTQQGSYFTSVANETANSSVILCIETGAMLEAHKYNEKVTHCLCLVRDDEHSPYKVLSPCGVCPGAPALLGRRRAGGGDGAGRGAGVCAAERAAAAPLVGSLPGAGAGALRGLRAVLP